MNRTSGRGAVSRVIWARMALAICLLLWGSLGVAQAASSAARAACPAAVNSLATSPAWTAEGDQAGADFGNSVSSAGDVNGDGYSDVIVAAYMFSNGQQHEGRACLYLGSASGLSTSPAWSAEADQEEALFGYSVSSAGDVDGDGYGDVIVGAPFYSPDGGRALVYLGSAAGLSASPAWTADGNHAQDEFGASVSSAGDVNGDGYGDVIVGAFTYSNDQQHEGRAYVYLGSPAGLAASPAWTAEGDQEGAFFGAAVSSAGDVNGDGYGDVIVGAFYFSNDEYREGRACLYLGSASGLSTSPAWTAEGDQEEALFGYSVSSAGDVNGDGYGDVIVGALYYDSDEADEGRTFLYLGSAAGLEASPAWTAEGAQAAACFGWSVASAGDVNGDGYGDIVIGASYFDNVEEDEGRACLYLGSASGLSASAAWVVECDQAGACLGSSVSSAGDVDGDGYADVIVGAFSFDNDQTDEGRAFVYLGSASAPAASADWTAESDQAWAEFGYSVASAGDVNGDGYGDVIVGVPYYSNGRDGEGQALVYLGSTAGLASAPAWSAEGDQAGAAFGYSVASAGDVNGDGYGDVIVGAAGGTNGEIQEGRAFVFLGSVSGLAAGPAWTAEGDRAGARFGCSVSSAGDVNGDGYGDVVIGADDWDNTSIQEGRAFVYLGSDTGLAVSPAWTGAGDHSAGPYFGCSVSSAGDVNGDGYGDVIVGWIGYTNGADDEGRATVYLGSISGLASTPAWTAEGNQAAAFLGSSVSSAGDVNGDGYGDVVVGVAGYTSGGGAGQARLYLGSASGLSVSPAWTAEGHQGSAWFGWSVSSAGDVNGDGYGDVIVGDPWYSNGQIAEGEACGYLGSASGLSASAAWMAEGDQESARFGISVSSAGDVNGDGYGDVIVGANGFDNDQNGEGRACLFYGNGEAGRGLSLRPRQWRGDGSAPVAPLGECGTQVRLKALGRSPFGRTNVKLECEVKPLGTAFDGTGTTISAAWTDTGVSGVELDLLVVLPPSLTDMYHWRMRLLYDPSRGGLPPASRWFTVPFGGWQEADFRSSEPPPQSFQVLVPFWQQGWGEQTFFSLYSAPDGLTGFDLGLDLFDETGNWLQSAPSVHLEPGELYPPDTGVGGWYASGDRFGGALVSLQYDAPPAAGDLFSAWAAVYTMAGGAQPGFTVPVPQSPLAPAEAGRGLRTGSGLVPIPVWETRGDAVTFYSLWNSPGSTQSADLTITWRDLAGTVVGGTAFTLVPGELACIETRPPLVPAGDWVGVGEIEIDFGVEDDPADQMVLWSTIYGVFGGAQVGFPVALELPDEPLPPPVANAERDMEFAVQAPFWQAGWDLNTVWSVVNSPESLSDVSVWLDLYGLDGVTLVDSSPALVLSPGQGGRIDTADVWYDAGWQLGVASIHLEYAVAPTGPDVVGLWSAVYSDPQPGDAHTGFTVSIPGAPVRPFNMAPERSLAGPRGLRAGEGTVLIPFWQEGLGVHSFWSLWNSPDSAASATVTVRLRDGGGNVVEAETSILAAGQAWLLDTQEGWYSSGEEYGAGEIEIDFAGAADPANQLTMWEAVYGFYLGYQVGYPVELS